MSRRKLSSFRWDGTQWASINISSNHQSNQTSSTPETIRIATLNILADCFPWFVEKAIRSSERYEWLVKAIPSLNATILNLNEVTVNALEQLKQCSFIRENYSIIELLTEEKTATNDTLFPHGCIILSKLLLLEVFTISCSGRKREAIVGKVQLGNTLESCVYICATHTTPYQSLKNAQLRAQQIRDIVQVLQPLGLPFVIMGDLNLYHKFEDAVVVENNLIDAWAQTHFSHIHPFNDGNEGYTFDAIKNTLIPYYIPGNRRQMRLDRILFSTGFPAFAIAPCGMWANEPIKSDNYLFPSDHFGLFIDLVTKITDNNKETISMSESDPSAAEILCRNAQNNTDERADRLGIVQRTKAYASHLFWLGGATLGLK